MGIIWSDVNFENNTIKISRNLFISMGKFRWALQKQKNLYGDFDGIKRPWKYYEYGENSEDLN